MYIFMALGLLATLPTSIRAGPTPAQGDTKAVSCHLNQILVALNSPYPHLQEWGLRQTLDAARRRHDVPLTTRLFDAVVRLYERSVDDRRILALATLLSFDADEARAYVHGHATRSEQLAARDRWLQVLNGK